MNAGAIGHSTVIKYIGLLAVIAQYTGLRLAVRAYQGDCSPGFTATSCDLAGPFPGRECRAAPNSIPVPGRLIHDLELRLGNPQSLRQPISLISRRWLQDIPEAPWFSNARAGRFYPAERQETASRARGRRHRDGRIHEAGVD